MEAIVFILNVFHHHNEYNQGVGLETCSIKAQGVLGLSIFVSVFPYPAVPEVGTGKPTLVGGFFPFIPGGITISSDTILCLLQCCSLLICYECQGFYGGPILEVLIVVSKISFVHLPVYGHWYLPFKSTQR
jgi:hypothetical protein